MCMGVPVFAPLPVHTLLAWCGNARGSKRAMRRSTAAVAYEVDTPQGPYRGQLFSKHHR